MFPLVMGVLNVTPDSFSDGGRWFSHAAAIEHGLRMVAEGADIIDVGGESTRPGADPVDEAEELRRVIPVVRELAPRVRVSIDTMKRAVAEAAVGAGATIVNDVSSSLAGVAASSRAGWIAMHMRGTPRTMQQEATYADVVADVTSYLVERAEAGRAAGIEEVWIDPGIGFAKTAAHNLSLLRRIGKLVETGYPVVVGTSRKSFLGPLSGGTGPDDRLEASVATETWAMAQGAAVVRVHDVAPAVAAARLVRATPAGEAA